MKTAADPLDSKLRILIASVRDYAIFMLDRGGRVASWNLGAQLIKGYGPDEIIGHSIDAFYSATDRAAGHPAELLAIARRDGRVEEEGWRVRKDGTAFWADVVITAMFDESRELIGYAKVTRDLTERRTAEEARLQEEQQFRLIVDGVRDYAIFMLDPTGHVATWNAGAKRIKGYETKEIVGKHISVFYPAEDWTSGKAADELETALRDGRFEEENWRVRKDGTRFWANVVLNPLRDASGQLIGFAKITRDLTSKREAEGERLKLAHAHEAIQLRDDFLSIASHELRTPLMALQLQIDTISLAVESSAPKVTGKLARAARSVRRLTELVDSVLDVARIASGRLTLEPTHSDLSEIVLEFVERMQEAAAKADCKVVAEIEPNIVGNWDALRLGQVVTNLLSNAFKYAAGSEVQVSLRAEGDEVILCVNDRGPGIEEGHLELIFARFHRAAAARHHGGLGLGLYVALEIVIAHGGSMRASNREGGGATIRMTLPIKGAR